MLFFSYTDILYLIRIVCRNCTCYYYTWVTMNILIISYHLSLSSFLPLSLTFIPIGEQRVMSLSMSEELKTRETQLDEVRKQLGQWESKLKQQQQLYEAVRSDRNHYSKGTSTRFLILLHCTVLYCTVLYCTVLCCAVIYHTPFHSNVLCCTALTCTVFPLHMPVSVSFSSILLAQ
jgi:hypothetical protein